MSRFKHIIDDDNTNIPISHPTVYTSVPVTANPYSNIIEQSPQHPSTNVGAWPTLFPKPIIGLEYDGVINVDVGPITSPDQWEPIDGSLEAIRLMRLKGYKVVILSDQGAITKGLQTHSQVESFHMRAMAIFGQAGIQSIDGFFYAESDLKEDVFAKPNIGMFERAEREIYQGKARFKNGGFYVGHRMKDIKAAFKANATPVLVLTGQGEQTEKDLQRFSAEKLRKKTLVYNNLLQFAQSLK